MAGQRDAADPSKPDKVPQIQTAWAKGMAGQLDGADPRKAAKVP